jgi:hypothetical protein
MTTRIETLNRILAEAKVEDSVQIVIEEPIDNHPETGEPETGQHLFFKSHRFEIQYVPADHGWKDAFFVRFRPSGWGLSTDPRRIREWIYLGRLDPDTGEVRTTKRSHPDRDWETY